MLKSSAPSFSLQNFEGPLDLLVQLIETKEIDIYQVTLEKVTSRYLLFLETLLEYDLDTGAEFLSTVASLMLLKSRLLLPIESGESELPESELRVEMIEQLLRYYQFKEIALTLKSREEIQEQHFLRGVPPQEIPEPVTELKAPESEHILVELMKEILERAKARNAVGIREEEYRVSDKIREWRTLLQKETILSFLTVFTIEKSKGELITLFLALLELIKIGEVEVLREERDLLIGRKKNES